MSLALPLKHRRVGILTIFILAFGLLLTEALTLFDIGNTSDSEPKEAKPTETFIIDTRKYWSDVNESFNRGSKAIYIMRNINEEKTQSIISREVNALEDLKKEIPNGKFHDERNYRFSSNVNLLLNNAVNELEIALKAEDKSEYLTHIEFANTQIELANKSFIELGKINGYDIKPLSKVSSDL